MTKLFYGAVAAAAFSLIVTASVAMAATVTSQQKTLSTFVGTWDCVTRTSDHKTYREKDVYTMWGPWLKNSVAYPAQEDQPAGMNIGYIRYDVEHSRWVSSFVDSQGRYRVLYSDSKVFVGSVWQNAYPDDNGSSTVKSLTAKTFVLVFTGKDSKGKATTHQQVCTRGSTNR